MSLENTTPNTNPEATPESRIANLEQALGQIGTAINGIAEKINAEEDKKTVIDQMNDEIDAVYKEADETVKAIREKSAPLVKAHKKEHDPIKKGSKVVGLGLKPAKSIWEGIKEGLSD